MTTPEALHTALVTRLRGVLAGRVTVYDGDVPAAPPADGSGRVYPYCVVWPSPGGTPSETAVHDTSGALDWYAQITVAAGDPTWCMQAVTVVRGATFTGPLVEGDGPLVDETPRSVTVTRDPDVTPRRWFVPLFAGCLTA